MPSRISRLFKLSLLAGCSLYGIGTLAHAQDSTTAASEEPQVVTVLGSRIPRTQKEGPAPVTTITSEQIRAGGYANVPDVLKTVTQNSGDTQSQQSGNAADYSPGAQQVDLRGLGPNHTLVMVNGRRVADYPMPFNGDANFTDISNIPLGMVDSIEILSGSASAVYGSDALAGVVNFKLKKHFDGNTLDYRYGWTEQGGGASHRLNFSSGFDSGKFHGVFGGEAQWTDPIYGYQRELQDSTLDAPDPAYQTAVTNWQRLDGDGYAIDASQADCALTSATNEHTTHYTIDDYYGDGDTILGAYCGSESAIGYKTVQSERHGVNLVGSFTYDLSDRVQLFADVQFGVSRLKLLKRPTSWSFQDPTGDDSGDFYNSNPSVDGYDNWYRIFTPEEMGGLDKAKRHVNATTFTISPGIRGTLGKTDKWNYEVGVNASVYNAQVTFPLINVDKANALFLGTTEGVNDDGYYVFNADPTRFYTPLTPTQYASIAEDAVYHPKSSVAELTAQIGTQNLFEMPAGPVGFNVLVEGGRQDYDQGTDPKATSPHFFSWTDFTAKGHRTHWAAATEFSVPLLSTLQGSAAARYDHYDYAGHSVGEATYNLGLEYRPIKTLLFRAAWGTGFRAPDLNYVYRGIGFEEGRATDYYQCYIDTPEDYPGDCGRGPRVAVKTGGNLNLEPETSESFNTGFVWAPSRHFDFSADYFKIDMKGEVEDLLVGDLTRTEGECRNGLQDVNTPTCQDAIARVTRDADGTIRQVFVSPINVAKESTSGVDLSGHARFDTPIGQLTLTGSYTHVIDHDYTRYTGDPVISKLAFDSDYYIPRDKASASVNLQSGKWSFNIDGNYTSRLPNYDEDAYVKAYTTYNGSIQYEVNESVRISLAIDNLFDTHPPKDNTWTSYPYYNSDWYDGLGRSGFLQVTYKFK